MPDHIPFSHPFAVDGLPTRKPTRFHLRPDAETSMQIAQLLNILTVQELEFKGEIRPIGKNDWELAGDLSAVIEQACIITLAPVQARVHEHVTRRYLSQMTVPEGNETEMPDDPNDEPLGESIDPAAVALEELALALPPYPRASDAQLEKHAFAAPGITPLTDEDLRPFAGLARLVQKNAKPDTDQS